METFQFFFGILLAEMVFRHTDNLSKTLQKPELSSLQGYEIAMLTVKTLQLICTESNFDLFWEKVDKLRSSVTRSSPCLPRKCRVLKQYDMWSGPAEFHSTAKDLYRQVYFEVFDLAVATITSRFNQPGYKVHSNIEQPFVKACFNKVYEQNLAFIAEFYGDDFNIQQLESQLATFRILYLKKASEQPSITSMRNVLWTLSCTQRSM